MGDSCCMGPVRLKYQRTNADRTAIPQKIKGFRQKFKVFGQKMKGLRLGSK